jgi:hypothetical protein
MLVVKVLRHFLNSLGLAHIDSVTINGDKVLCNKKSGKAVNAIIAPSSQRLAVIQLFF